VSDSHPLWKQQTLPTPPAGFKERHPLRGYYIIAQAVGKN